MPDTAKIAGAPISWGVCEVPGWGRVLDTETVLGEMRSVGLLSTELGPPGYLPGEPDALRAKLSAHDLGLVGGFLATVVHRVPDDCLTEAERTAELLAAAGAEVLVLAAATGLAGYDDRPALNDAEWRTLIDTVGRIRDLAAGHGLRTVLHPHVGTHVENEADVERFVADSDLQLCLDTGHLLIGGTDPVALARRHPDRIGHVHLKDVRADLAARVREGRLGYAAAVGAGLYVPLGDGDVEIEQLLRLLTEAGYPGWYVLEQDTALTEHTPSDVPRRDTARSLDHLATVFQALVA